MTGMNVYEIRRLNLAALRKEYGTLAAICDKADLKNTSYLSQVSTNVPTPSGKRREMGSKTARKLEQGLELPDGWMDVLHEDECYQQGNVLLISEEQNKEKRNYGMEATPQPTLDRDLMLEILTLVENAIAMHRADLSTHSKAMVIVDSYEYAVKNNIQSGKLLTVIHDQLEERVRERLRNLKSPHSA